MLSAWIDRHLKWVLTLPAVLFILIMMVFPLGYTLRLSFFEWSMSAVDAPKWVGLNNYKELLTNSDFWNATFNSFYFTSASLIIEIVLGVGLAILFFRDFKGSSIAKTVLILPMVATPVAVGLIWMLIYEPTIGIANAMLKSIGLSPLEWLGSQLLVIPSLVLIDVWQSTPLVIVIVMAGLATISKEPYEAASIDGASRWQKLRYITLPLLVPSIYIAIILRLIELLKAFDTIYATTQGGPNSASETINIFGYLLAFDYFKIGMASALFIIFLFLLLIITSGLIMLRRMLGVRH